MMLGGIRSSKPPIHGGFAPHTSHRGLHHQASNAFELNPPSQLVIGHHWLAFLNQVCRESQTQLSTFPIH